MKLLLIPVGYVLLAILAGYCRVQAQSTDFIHGLVLNDFTKESVPFASVYWKKARFGVNTDSAGNFRIKASPLAIDTLAASYVGYKEVLLVFRKNNPVSESVVLALRDLKEGSTVQVSSRFNKGLRWWKAVVAHKFRNNPYQYHLYSYERYSKTELDISNVPSNYFEEKKFLRPFAFVLKNIDSTSEAKPFLPVYMTETLSDCYTSTDPHKSKEVIRAAKADGLKNESILQFVGGFNQRVNVYDNYSTALGKEFISPLSDVGDKYYHYRGADTQYIAGKRYLHLFFQPKRAGENTFSGDCWILDGNWGIYRISLDISGSADVNYVNRLSVVQEFALQTDSSWIFRKEKTIIDFAPFKKEKVSFIARRTELYRNVIVNDSAIASALRTNQEKDEIIVEAGAREKDSTYWNTRRHEDLTITEQKVYQMMDTIKTVPAFIHYTHILTFIFDGHHAFGPIEIGPWFKWISGNQLEKIRIRFDLGTTDAFSKSLRLHTYLAYGFGDGKMKGKLDITYKPSRRKGWTYFLSYTHDLDNGRTRYNDEDITTDNIFSQLIRRPGIRQKFLGVDEIKLAITKEWASHFSMQPFFIRTDYETYLPLPSRTSLFSRPNQDALVSTEFGIKLRYAPGERTITTHRRERRLRTDQPVFELRTAIGLPHLLGSEYKYRRVGMNISQNFRIPRWGKANYMVYAGKIYSDAALPFMVLEIHPGNEIYYYNRQSFNLMNRFEYISDRFIGFNMEHNLEKKLLNLLPFLRKTSVRQFWNLKSVWGDLSDDNRKLNIKDYYYAYRMRSLRGGIYTEIGTGLENIFKLLRVDVVWRYAPLRNIPPGMSPMLFKSPTDFGVFGSVRLQL